MSEVRRPRLDDRPDFIGSRGDYEWLAEWFGYDVNIIVPWRGHYSGLLVLSNRGEPLSNEQVREFRQVLGDFTPCGTVLTVVSVG